MTIFSVPNLGHVSNDFSERVNRNYPLDCIRLDLILDLWLSNLWGDGERSYPTSKVRGGSGEEQPHVQEAAAARAQEGREELLHVQGQEGQPRLW